MKTLFVASLAAALSLRLLMADPAFAEPQTPGLVNLASPAFGAAVRSYLLENPEVLAEVFGVLEDRQKAAQIRNDLEIISLHREQLFEDGDGWLGTKGAKTVIVEFADYRCSFCKANHEVLVNWVTNTPDTAIIIKEFPILGPQSVLAAETALAVRILYGNDAYQDFHNLVYSYRANITPSIIRTFIETEGHSFEAVQTMRLSADVTDRISATKRLAQLLGIQGTPSFVANDQIHRGMITSEVLASLIEGG